MQWHDLFGAVLFDFFAGSPFVVTGEIDLSLKKQYLDLLVVRRESGEFDRPLPDGFAPLANHNLITFKSHQDTFDSWSLLELLGAYVSYRKQVSAEVGPLAPEEEFRLFAVSARFPEGLAKQITLEETQPGVYDINVGSTKVCLLVVRRLAKAPVNAMMQLFSLVPDQIDFACQHYRPRSRQTTGIVDELIRMYEKEDRNMVTTLEELNRKIRKELLETATVQERLKGLTPEQRLEGLPAEERLRGLAAEERLKGLAAEERLKGLSAEEIEAYLRELKKNRGLNENECIERI